MGPGRDQTCDPWICSQTCYRLHYASRHIEQVFFLYFLGILLLNLIGDEPAYNGYIETETIGLIPHVIEYRPHQLIAERSGSVGRALDWGSKGC